MEIVGLATKEEIEARILKEEQEQEKLGIETYNYFAKNIYYGVGYYAIIPNMNDIFFKILESELPNNFKITADGYGFGFYIKEKKQFSISCFFKKVFGGLFPNRKK